MRIGLALSGLTWQLVSDIKSCARCRPSLYSSPAMKAKRKERRPTLLTVLCALFILNPLGRV
jgi:hypothetical protein